MYTMVNEPNSKHCVSNNDDKSSIETQLIN